MNFSAPKRLVLFIAAFVAVFFLGCSKASGPQTAPNTSSQSVASTTPPFATREPERYRATRIITTNQNGSDPLVVTTRIARDSGNRREEYQAASGATVVYLDNAEGSFVVLPAKKLYAQAYDGGTKGEFVTSQRTDSPRLDQTRGGATYESLGNEQLGERMTSKYRVTYKGASEETTFRAETLIWIDESLGMPIRSETRSIESDRPTTVLMELRDIATEVDPQVFLLSRDYKLIDIRALLAE